MASLVAKYNQVFECIKDQCKVNNQSSKVRWMKQESLVQLFDDYIDSCNSDIENPLQQHSLINAGGFYGATDLNTFSDLIVAIRYCPPSEHLNQNLKLDAINLVFEWRTINNLCTRKCTATVPQTNLWYKMDIPVPSCLRIFGALNVYQIMSDGQLQHLDSEVASRIEVTGMLLKPNDKHCLYHYGQ